MRLAELRERARTRPGFCAVCGRQLRTSGRGRTGIICSPKERKECRALYGEAYRESVRPKRLRRMVTVKRSPEDATKLRVELECGHHRDLMPSVARGRRRSMHCLQCTPPAKRKPRAISRRK